MKAIRNSLLTGKTKLMLVILFTTLLSSCEINVNTSKPESFYEGRWEIHSLKSNLTGMEYDCYGILDIEWEHNDFYYYMDLYDWPYYADWGTVRGDNLYNDMNQYYAFLSYRNGRLYIDTRDAGYEFSFRARRI